MTSDIVSSCSFATGLLIKVSQKPSEALRKLNKTAGFMTYEHIVAFTRGIFLSHEPTHGVFHSNLQRCKYSFRSNSSFKSYDFAPTDASCISWIMILWNLAIRPKNLCSFLNDGYLQLPLLEVVAGKFAELPQEILMEIFALLETPDLVRAGSVCCSWNSAYTSTCGFRRYKWPQTPCLIYTSESAGDNVAFIYSLEEKRAYKLTLPEPPIHRRYLIGSSNGWLVTADERSEMHLVNPITSEQISLPSVVTIEQVTPVFYDNGAICKYHYSRHTADLVVGPPSTYSLSTLRDHLFHKALLFFTTSAGSYIVVLIHNPLGQLSFARLGDEKWTWLPPHSNFEDCIYKDGLLYAVTLLGQIITFEYISGAVVTTKIIMDRKDSYGVERVYIVQDPLGDLLLVRRPEVWIKEASTMHGHGHSHAIFENINWRIAIYKVCIASRKLVRINSLDEHVLFLGHSESLCLSAEDYPEVKPNHVYFTDDSMSVSLKCKLRRRLVIGMFNLETKIMDEIVYPQPWSNCMAPLLLMPNPRKLFLALVTKH